MIEFQSGYPWLVATAEIALKGTVLARLLKIVKEGTLSR